MNPLHAAPAGTLTLSPTLLIGLGGTGKDVLLRIRRLFYERFGKRDGYLGFPIIGYLALDTDGGSFDRIEGETLSHFVLKHIQFKRGDGREAIDCSVTPDEFSQYFKGGPPLYPHIFSWLLPDMIKYGSAAIVEGAGQNRPFGRLAFFHNYPEIRRALAAQVQEIIGFAKDQNLLPKWKPDYAEVDANRLEVIFVYSLAGGTGAGMFLDAGLAVKELVREYIHKGNPELRPHFTHFAVMPEPFVQAPRPHQRSVVEHERLQKKIQENAFTALREMEYFSMRQSEARFDLSIPPAVRPVRAAAAAHQAAHRMPWERDRSLVGSNGCEPLYRVQWERQGPVYEITECPWDTCYILGGKNNSMGPNCLPLPEIYQMVAEHIFLDFDPSDFGTRKRSLRSNLHEQTLASMKDVVYDESGNDLYCRYMSRRFSSFGISQIYFDRERMRRAASYWLAARLVQERWLRQPEPGPKQLRARAVEDLKGGADQVVTNTHLSNDPCFPLTFDGICWRVSLIEPGSDKAWWDMSHEEAVKLEREIEDHRYDPMTGETVIGNWRDKHELRLKKSMAKAGEEGLALRNISDLRKRLDDEVERRLRYLFLFRIQELGPRGCLEVFREYNKLTADEIHETDRVRTEVPAEGRDWRDRLREAQRLPLAFYARRAARWELLRSVRSVGGYLAQKYAHGAAPETLALLGVVHQRVAEDVAEGSYAQLLRRFIDLLETNAKGGVLFYLRERFNELKSEDRERRRVIGLLATENEAEYEGLVRRSLDPAAPAKTPLDWEDIERRVLEQFRKNAEQDKKWKDVNNLGELILRLYHAEKSPDHSERLPQAVAEEFARTLAEACEVLLGKFAGHTSALKQFTLKADEQVQRLRKLRVLSAPYLSRNPAVNAAAMLETEPTIYLGIAQSDAPEETEAFKNKLREAGEADHDPLHNMQLLSMKDDAIVLYQEKAGLPLCYYAGLVQLGEIYDRSERKKETYLDHFALRDVLPEIRLVDQVRQHRLARCLESALYGMITGVLRYETQSNRFRLSMRQGGGGALEFPVGSQLEEVANHCAQNDDSQRELEAQVTRWIDTAARRSPELLGILWCAIQYLQEEIRIRVQALIDAEQEEYKPSGGAHPLLAILAKRMLPFVRDKLSTLPQAAAWIDSPLNWALVSDRHIHSNAADKDRAWREWQEQFKECFRVIKEGDMPIPVIQPNARLKVAAPDEKGHHEGNSDAVPSSRLP